MTRARNPAEPPGALVRTGGDIVESSAMIWRVHRVGGPRRDSWRTFRHFGPMPTGRFDPHPYPLGPHPGYGMCYTAGDVGTCVAEVFAPTRSVQTDGFHLTGWAPTRPLRLLDLSGDWALRNGASHSLYAAPRRVCRNWSHAIRDTWPDLDGLWVPSTLTGETNVALYEPATDAMPDSPRFSRQLANPAVWNVIDEAARRIGYELC